MKKLMSLVLALAMILSLAACGGKTTGTSPDSAGDSQQETPATSDGAFPEKADHYYYALEPWRRTRYHCPPGCLLW